MKSDMMKYKGYKASISFDEEDKIFVGEVFGIADSLNFHGRSIDELEEAFHDSIENYLEICKKIGKNPQKEFSGTFNVRTTPALHEQAAEICRRQWNHTQPDDLPSSRIIPWQTGESIISES